MPHQASADNSEFTGIFHEVVSKLGLLCGSLLSNQHLELGIFALHPLLEVLLLLDRLVLLRRLNLANIGALSVTRIGQSSRRDFRS